MTLQSLLIAALVFVGVLPPATLLVGVAPAHAAQSCAATTVSATAFGSPNMLTGAAVDTTATISVSCTGGLPNGTQHFCLSIGAGSGGVDGSNNRLMTASGGGTITYNLFQDSARTLPWGSRTNSALGTVPAMAGTVAGGNVSFTVTIFGRIAASQTTVAPGSYSSSFSGSSNTNFFMLNGGQTNCMTSGINANPPAVNPSFSATATPGANCNITTNPLAFGTQGLLNANVDASTTMSVQCTNTTPYNVGLDPGQAIGATVTTRKMTSGANSVSYSLYHDSGRTQNWGQTIGTDTVSGTGTGLSQTITVYGRVPTQTTPAPATYNDTVVATVTY